MSAVARDADVYRKMTATPAGCVRTSQAGTKLDRTQTAVGLLRFVMLTSKYLHLITKSMQIKKSNDFFIGARGFSNTAVTAGC